METSNVLLAPFTQDAKHSAGNLQTEKTAIELVAYIAEIACAKRALASCVNWGHVQLEIRSSVVFWNVPVGEKAF